MVELLTDADGAVTGAVVETGGKSKRIGARLGVILASGGFDHDLGWRKELLPEVDQDWSFGNPAAMGDGIRAAQRSAPPRTCSTKPGGSLRSNGRTAACNSCSTNG